MRKLTKGPIPQILEENADLWTTEILAALDAGENPTNTQKRRYNHPQIKEAIVSENFGKCAYCESFVIHIDFGDIEHLIPKSKVPSKAFLWSNLTLACRRCNVRKGDFHEGDDDHSGLVDPTVDDPEDHFTFHREIIAPIPGDPKGIKTFDVIDLGRGELIEKRRERLDFINGLIGAYLGADDEVKEILLADLYKRSVRSDCEYSAFAAHYLNLLVNKGVIPEQP